MIVCTWHKIALSKLHTVNVLRKTQAYNESDRTNFMEMVGVRTAVSPGTREGCGEIGRRGKASMVRVCV